MRRLFPTFKFDPSVPVWRMTQLAAMGFSAAEHDGAGRDVNRAKQQEKRKEVMRANLKYSKEIRS